MSVFLNPLNKESEEFWQKMLIFKEKYKEKSRQLKLLESNLITANSELTKCKRENALLTNEIKLEKSRKDGYLKSINELQKIKENYSTLLKEKRKVDDDLAAERKRRLSEKKESESAMTALKEEVAKLMEHGATGKSEIRKREVIIDGQNRLIENLKQMLLNKAQEADSKNDRSSYHTIDQSYENKILELKRQQQQMNEPAKTDQRDDASKPDVFEFADDDIIASTEDCSYTPTSRKTAATAKSESMASLGKIRPQLDVSRVPRKIRKAPFKKKRVLYSRKDDMD